VKLLLEIGADTGRRDRQGRTPLHLTAQTGLENVVKALIEAGDGSDARYSRGLTVLHRAAEEDDTTSTQLLLDVKANKKQSITNRRLPYTWL